MAEYVSGIGAEAYKDVKNGVVYVGKEIFSGKTLKEKRECLTDAANKLDAKRQHIMELKRNNKKRASKVLELWMDRAERLDKKVRHLKAKHEKEIGTAWRTFRFFHRSNLSKRMEEMCYDLNKCCEDSINSEEMFVEEPRRIITRKLKAPNIEGKSSLFKSFQKALQFLEDTSLKRIGIWGTVGVGKTAILQNLQENEQIAGMFGVVIFLTLAKEWDDEKLQLEIAKRLEINLEDIGGTGTIASSITKKLESKRYLFLLDDVERNFDLDDIGICDNNSKVILASRIRGICRWIADEVIEVKPLSEDDALKLFQEQLGRSIHSWQKPFAQKIVRECGNLPLLIDRVARNFRNRDDKISWRSGCDNLRNSQDQDMDEVLNLLRFFYEELRDENQQKCFLYGALYPEGCSIFIDYLVECWRAEGFIADTEKSPRDRGQEILHDLIDVSMLESSEKVKHVRMEKIFRKLALNILRKGNSKSLVEAGEKLEEPPAVTDWTDAERVSLMDSKLQKLPENLKCAKLLTLLLQKNDGLTLIPKPFFESMSNLRVLDLHQTNIGILPASISFLKDLRALYLNSCKNLAALPNKIKALKKLEVLDIRGTRISSVPTQIRHLDRLWCFRMSFSNVEAQPMCFHMPFTRKDTKSRKLGVCRNAISKLCSLNELVIDVDPEIQWWSELVKAIIQGTQHLKKLRYLTLSIDQCHSSKHKILDCYDYESCYCLKYANRENVDPGLEDVLAKTNAFELIGYKGVVALSDFFPNGSNNMKTCLIEGCVEMETVFNGTKINSMAFQSLEKIYISHVPKLQSICKGDAPVSADTLNQLTTLVLFNCPTLTNIFCTSFIQQLPNLCHLEVESCHEVKEIIKMSENIVLNRPVFESLSTLMLIDLPSLVSFWNDSTLEWPSTEKPAVVVRCPQLRRSPHSQASLWKTMQMRMEKTILLGVN